MIYIVIYLLGCITVLLLSKEIMILGYKTMKQPYKDDYKSFFETEDYEDFPDWLYMIMAIALSWIFVFLTYVVTLIIIKQKRDE